MIITSSENTSSSITPPSRRTSRKAISATPLDIRPVASAKGASIRVTYVPMKAPANFPTRGTRTRPTIVEAGRSVKDRSKYKPAEAKNSGTKRPSEALRMPGMMSLRTPWESPDRAAPNSSAPMVPCRPILSAPTTIRKSPPMRRPNESWGTLTKRCRPTMATGSTFADSSQASVTKATILPTRARTESAVTLGRVSPRVKPTTSSEAISAMITMVKILSPMGCLRVPESDRTLAARPRLDSDSTPASASASLNSRPSPRSSPKRSDVTARAATSDMTTEMMAAAK